MFLSFMCFLIKPIVRFLGLFYVKTIFRGKKIFFKFHIWFLLSFLCTTIETIFSIVLSENDLLRNIFFIFSSFFFLCFWCKAIDTIFRNNSCINDLSWKKISLIFTFCFLTFLLCITIKKIISLVLYENQFFREYSFFFLGFISSFFLCQPIDAIFRSNLCKNDRSWEK